MPHAFERGLRGGADGVGGQGEALRIVQWLYDNFHEAYDLYQSGTY